MYNSATLDEDSSVKSIKAVQKPEKNKNKDSNKHMEHLEKVAEKYFGEDQDPDNMLDSED